MADISEKSLKNYNLAGHTTLKIGGTAEEAYFPSSIQEIQQIREHLVLREKKITIIGAGSNLLVSSSGVSGGVIFTSKLCEYELLEPDLVRVGAGIKSWDLARILYENSLSGLEFLIGIPGTVGGAVTMNSSAHGQAIEDVVIEARVFDIETGNIKILDKSMLQLGYRNSFVEQNKHIILDVTFRLKEDRADEILKRMEFHTNYRKERHPPLTEPTAGSTFRNPQNQVYIGQLLEEIGAKSWREGGAKISEKHANFIINTGRAVSTDVSRLMNKMHDSVLENFGYDLVAEIRFIGVKTSEEEEIWKKFQVH